MSKESSSQALELKLRQEMDMEPTTDETSNAELTLKTIDKRIKQATDPILR